MIEVLVAITLAGIMITSIFSILMSINRMHQRSVAHYEISKIAQSVMEELNFAEVLEDKDFDEENYAIEITKEKIDAIKKGYRIRLKLQHVSLSTEYLLYGYVKDRDVIAREIYYEIPIEPWELLD
ncbi:hypothetical protein CACET_c18340 [Clostridium aceticum]|uniref:Uncharacterized protein n=1 Tax=Clostridium aceticum TaxID=84022 RepID=A0A0D8IDF5_9CLOT|nr:hypothetical protein CACET_c18340 [Clostridium aceticum]KJF28129.1 hypothetical protein TZ02_06190 [Clostridium aceticum]